jgi:hypothetical protein
MTYAYWYWYDTSRVDALRAQCVPPYLECTVHSTPSSQDALSVHVASSFVIRHKVDHSRDMQYYITQLKCTTSHDKVPIF